MSKNTGYECFSKLKSSDDDKIVKEKQLKTGKKKKKFAKKIKN